MGASGNTRRGLAALAAGMTVAAFAGAARAEDARLYELRTYHAAPGKFEALKTRFRDHTLRFFDKHGITSVAYWTTVEETGDGTLVYVVSYPDRQAREASWAAFRADPGWQAAQKASEADGKLTVKVDSVFLKAADFSPPIAGSR